MRYPIQVGGRQGKAIILLAASALFASLAFGQQQPVGAYALDGSDYGLNAASCAPPLACAGGAWSISATPTFTTVTAFRLSALITNLVALGFGN
jgi:hypothetical protein